MVLNSNVAKGARKSATPCPRVLLQLACSFLLLPTCALGGNHRRLHIRGSPTKEALQAADAGAADVNEEAEDALINEAKLASGAVNKTLEGAEDLSRVAASEDKKMRKHLKAKFSAALPSALSDDDAESNYMIASFPELRCINYVRMPDVVWRPLVVSGLGNPQAIVIDEERNRLYIADSAVAKVVWYQLLALPDKKLITGGRQAIAVGLIVARSLALDLDGNLFISGKTVPAAPLVSVDGIFKQSLMNIDQSASSGTPLDPASMWTKAHTGSSVAPMVLDAFSIYYGNELDGKTKGSVVKAGKSAPLANPAGGLTAMADNADTTYSLAVTPTAIFYGVDNAIYGVLKSKVGGSCGATGDQCSLITDMVKKPTAMSWNGDGTVYVADNGGGAIYAFASASVSPHALEKVIDAGHVYGVDVYKVNFGLEKNSVQVPHLSIAMLLLSTALARVF